MPSLFNVLLLVRRLRTDSELSRHAVSNMQIQQIHDQRNFTKPPIRPAIAKSKLHKLFSMGNLQQDQVAGKIKKTANDTNSSANRDTQKNPYQTLSGAVNNGGDTSMQSGDNTDGGVKKDYRVGYRNDGLLGCSIESCCHTKVTLHPMFYVDRYSIEYLPNPI